MAVLGCTLSVHRGTSSSMTSILSRGLAAGAVGTTVLNAATWIDMAITGRPASDAPEQTAAGVLEAVGVEPPSDSNRRTAHGALGGIATGLAVGLASSAVRALGLKVPAPVGAALSGAAAMAATDLSMAATGVSDPRSWTPADWLRDAVPHLAYGVGVRWTLDRLTDHDHTAEQSRDMHPVTPALLGRSALLGAATGGRASLGLSGPLVAHGLVARLSAAGLVGTELVLDKLPSTTSRLIPGALIARAGAGGVGAGVLAHRQRVDPALPALAGAAGALAGSFLGAAWRELAAQRGYTWQAALVEDVAAISLTWLAIRETTA